ncbi:hypothetical protein [Flindersiella endophytica]
MDTRCRGWGAGAGSPRQIIDPWAQLDDLRAVISHVRGGRSGRR